MLDMYCDNSYCVVARLLHVYTFSVLKSCVQTEISKGSALHVWIHRGIELYNRSLSFEVILCADYIRWYTCLLIWYFSQPNECNSVLFLVALLLVALSTKICCCSLVPCAPYCGVIRKCYYVIIWAAVIFTFLLLTLAIKLWYVR
jgi:hypothetical protein